MNHENDPIPVSNSSQELIEAASNYYIPNYHPSPIVLSHGKGARIWDTNQKEYIDLGAGISVTNLGHADPELIVAMVQQAEKLWHTSNLYHTEPAILLAQELVQATFANRVFFANSGAEANEAAIKLARKYMSRNYSYEKSEIITFSGSFHGRTMATIAATAQPKYQEGFQPLPGGFTYCEFNNFLAAEKCISPKTCAVMVEPIQGEGGLTPAKEGFLLHLQQLCRQHNALLIIDEVQSGMGRTGKLFAYEWENGINPDIVSIAKALGGGIPIGAVLASEKIAHGFQPGDHGSTFGGNPIATAVARVVLEKIVSPELMAHVRKQGKFLMTCLETINEKKTIFQEIRGKGLMIGAEFAPHYQGKASEIREQCLQKGVLLLQAGPNVLRFLPPLTIEDEELHLGLERVQSALETL